MLRTFDISAVYLHDRSDGVRECIDGRQRLNAIMSFLGENPKDEHNGFAIRIQNEIGADDRNPYTRLDGKTYAGLRAIATAGGELQALAKAAVDLINGYEFTTVLLSDVGDEGELNLQFLRLNLGVLINAGEKLHAMVGGMRDVAFDRIGAHEFFDHVQIPTRRYTKEVTAAQVLLHAFTFQRDGSFGRARHVDLQRFFKEQADVAAEDPLIGDIEHTLDELVDGVRRVGPRLRNRAISVSIVLLAWRLRRSHGEWDAAKLWEFLEKFLDRLATYVDRMRQGVSGGEPGYLEEFQRHLTQASVERPAVEKRHEILQDEFNKWLDSARP